LRRRGAALAPALLALLALGAAVLPAGLSAAQRPRWDTRVFAHVGSPGFPAHAYVRPDGQVFEGTYVNPAGDSLPSKIFDYSSEGALLRSWTMPGQDLSGEHGVQVATSDAAGRLVLLDHTPPRAVILDPATGSFSAYADFPSGSVPNYAVWLPDGSLLVSDYAQPVIWRIPAGGGTPTQWLTDPRLAGNGFGTTGLALTPDHGSLLVDQQFAGEAAPRGAIFSVALNANGGPAGGLTQIWQSQPFDLPDGIAVAQSGRIYVALLGPNQIATLAADGTEQERFPSLPITGENGSPVPFDQISSVAFLGTRLITANQSYVAGNAEHQVLHDVETGEPGAAELIPESAGRGKRVGDDITPPRLRNVRVRHRGHRARLLFSVNEKATVTVRVFHKGHVVRGARRKFAAGRGTLKLPGRFRPGRYRLVVRAVDPSANASRAIRRSLRID
jgi:sugar lactone lactonase YvrE